MVPTINHGSISKPCPTIKDPTSFIIRLQTRQLTQIQDRTNMPAKVNAKSRRGNRKIKKSMKLSDANFGIFYGPNKGILEECFMRRKIEMKEKELVKILFVDVEVE